MKLKTLKDLKKAYGFLNCNINSKELKQESIKWIKKDIETAKREVPFGVAKQIINRWIKRFSITEKDLK